MPLPHKDPYQSFGTTPPCRGRKAWGETRHNVLHVPMNSSRFLSRFAELLHQLPQTPNCLYFTFTRKGTLSIPTRSGRTGSLSRRRAEERSVIHVIVRFPRIWNQTRALITTTSQTEPQVQICHPKTTTAHNSWFPCCYAVACSREK